MGHLNVNASIKYQHVIETSRTRRHMYEKEYHIWRVLDLQHYSELWCAVVCCSVSQCVAVRCGSYRVLQCVACVAVRCGSLRVLQCVEVIGVSCSTLRFIACVAVCCVCCSTLRVLQCVVVHIPPPRHDRVLDIQHYSESWCAVVCCSVSQCAAVRCGSYSASEARPSMGWLRSVGSFKL